MNGTDMMVASSTTAEHTTFNRTSNVILIARKEIAQNFITLRMPIAATILLAMFIFSAYLMAGEYRQRSENWQINQAAQQDKAVGGVVVYTLPDGSFNYSAGVSHDPPMQPPQPLSTLVKGLDSEVDRAISVRQQIAFGSRQEGIESSGPSGTPDTFFMVKLLVSLFALIISLGTVTRERESGTLRLLLVQPVRRRTIILGKALGATACLLICLAIAFLGQFLYLKIGQDMIQDRQEVLRVLLLFAVAALYGIVFVLLGLFISTVAVRTRAAIVMALLGWVTIVLVLPNTAVLLANLLSPAPSYNQLNARLHEARQQVINQTLRENPGVTSVLDLPNAREVIFRAFETDRRITDEYLDSKLHQVKLAHLLSALSPAGALSSGQSSLAGTGVSAYSSYLQFLRSQRDMIVAALERQWDMPAPEGARLVQRTMQEINQQQRPAEGLEASLRSSALPSLSLIFWGATFGLGAWWRFERYDVR